MPRKSTKISKEVWLNIYNLKQRGVNFSELCEQYSLDYKDVIRICKTMEVCEGNLDVAYSLPYRVTQKNRDYIKNWLSAGTKKEENVYSDEFVPVDKKETKNYRSIFSEGPKNHVIPIKTQYRAETNSKITNSDYTNVVKHYIPDYRREISPNELSVNYEYGGIKFCVNKREGTIIFKNLKELVSGCDNDNIQFEPGEYDKNTIQEIINIGEALVGIGMFFKSQV